ncbi:MAG: hypothetical protein JWQ97_4009 [Phenylobacterium sp.]|nr:hypothetical protein [Phenylobacterium sp.]
MKAGLLGLTALLLAGAAHGAMAQDHHWRAGGPGEPPAQGNDARQPAQPAQPPQPQAAPNPQQAPANAQPGPSRRGDQGGGGRPSGGPGEGRRDHAWEGDRRSDGAPPERPGGPRFDNGQGRRDGNGGEGRRRDGNPDQGGHRDWNGGDRGQRDWNRGDNGGQRDWNRDNRDQRGQRDWGGGDRGRQDWNGGRARRDTGRWEPHRYPPSYHSPNRFRGPAWRPPRGFYARAWRFGEILPYGWYTPDYRVLDWWDYDLPEPPPGYDWVRVGADAMLIDDYTGRIVQVVRLVFW